MFTTRAAPKIFVGDEDGAVGIAGVGEGMSFAFCGEALDVVSKGRALREGVVLFLNQVGVVLGNGLQLVQGGVEHGRVRRLEDGLAVSRD